MNAVYESFQTEPRPAQYDRSASHCSTGCRSRSTAWSVVGSADGVAPPDAHRRHRGNHPAAHLPPTGGLRPDTRGGACAASTSDEEPRRHRRGRRVAAGREGIHRRADVHFFKFGPPRRAARRGPRAIPEAAVEPRSAMRPSDLPGSASAGSPSRRRPTWRSGISRARRSGRRSGCLLGGGVPSRSCPSACQRPQAPCADTIRNTNALIDRAREDGFRAAKIEALTETTANNDEDGQAGTRRPPNMRAPIHAERLSMSATAGTPPDEAIDCVRRLEELNVCFPRDTVHARAGRRVPPARRGDHDPDAQAPRS